MAIPVWAPSAVQAGTSLAKYLFRGRGPKFDRTPYAQRLKQLMEQGVFTPRYRSEVIGEVARTTGGLTQQAKAGYRGRLAKAGMLGSIAGAGKLAELDTAHADRLSEASRKMAMINAQSKSEAATEYARSKTAYQQGRREQEQQARSQLFGGLAGAAGSLASNILDEKLLGARTAYYNRMGQKDMGPNVTGLMEQYLHMGMPEEQFLGSLVEQGYSPEQIEMIIGSMPEIDEKQIIQSVPAKRTDTSYRQRVKNMRTRLGTR